MSSSVVDCVFVLQILSMVHASSSLKEAKTFLMVFHILEGNLLIRILSFGK